MRGWGRRWTRRGEPVRQWPKKGKIFTPFAQSSLSSSSAFDGPNTLSGANEDDSNEAATVDVSTDAEVDPNTDADAVDVAAPDVDATARKMPCRHSLLPNCLCPRH